MNLYQKPIPKTNYRVGRKGNKISLIVLHIGEGFQNQIYQEFLNPTSEKSAHYSVDTNGDVLQFVSTDDTAFCNGVVVNPTNQIVIEAHAKKININEIGIGIEHSGYAVNDITEAQYGATARLVNDLSLKYGIPLDRTHIIRHSEIRASKSCPGKLDADRIVRMALQIRNFQPLEKKTEEIKKEIGRLQQIVDLLKQISFLKSLIEKYGK